MHSKLTVVGLKPKEALLKDELKQIRSAVEVFHLDTGLYPIALANLAQSRQPEVGLDANGVRTVIPPNSFRGPYLSHVDVNPIDDSKYIYIDHPGLEAMGTVKAHSGPASDGSNYADW